MLDQVAQQFFTVLQLARAGVEGSQRHRRLRGVGVVAGVHHQLELLFRRFRLARSTDLRRHVGKRVLMAGMYTTGKPVHTAKHEPMQFATFDDGHGLVECVLFPDVYAARSHVLFDQGPFIFRGVVEESFGAVTVTVTHLERLERMLGRLKGEQRTANGEQREP